MGAIINGFETLIGNIKALFTIIQNFFSMLGHSIMYITKITQLLIGLIGQIPPWISRFMMTTLAIAIIYMFIGRVGGHN